MFKLYLYISLNKLLVKTNICIIKQSVCNYILLINSFLKPILPLTSADCLTSGQMPTTPLIMSCIYACSANNSNGSFMFCILLTHYTSIIRACVFEVAT